MFSRINYLGKISNIVLILICFFGLYWGGAFVLILTLPSILILFSARKSFRPHRETNRRDSQIYLAPISGRLRKISKRDDGSTVIAIRSNFFSGWSLLLPISGEMLWLKKNQNVLPSYFDEIDQYSDEKLEVLSKTSFCLKSNDGQEFQLDCYYPVEERAPHIWMKSGDCGVGSAAFGYLPQGGWVFCYLPKGVDVLVVTGEYVLSGDSVLAVVKNDENIKRIDHGL